MPKKRKACPNPFDTGKQRKAGRPSTEYTTHDAVKLVLDNGLKYHLAINALCLQGSLTKQRLQYFVSLEKERRRRSRHGLVVPSTISTNRGGGEEDSTLRTETSPLTIATSEESKSHTTSNSSGRDWGKKSTRRSPRQVSIARLNAKTKQDAERERYSAAFKEATTILAVSPTRRGETAKETILRLNDKHGITNEAKKLVKSTVYSAIASGNTGKSPKKKGPIAKIPKELVDVCGVHAEVCQVSASGELRGRDMKRLISAATIGTEFEGQFTVESVWRKVRRELPEKLQAANKLSVDDARAQWTTHQNLQQWFDDAKLDLIATGLCIDQEVRDANGNLVSELDFRSDEVKRRILNMDETHHDLSVTGDRGGPRSVVYHNPRFQRGCKRGVKSSRHVTGVYATSSAGENIPPMYIFDTGAKIEDNFRVKTQWLHGLPTVTGRYGCPTLVESSSFFAVRTRGSMDDSLFNSYIDDVILPLFPNISKHASFDAATGKLLSGPVVLKVDSGPGRIVASLNSISKRATYFEMGLIILSGLPNSTSVQQEMDALYGPFKSATYARGESILIEKIKDRGMRRAMGTAPGRGSSILSLGFDDLATIVNGNENDELSMKPFDKSFTKEKILKAWTKIGFVPFTRNCAFDKKVRHELGQANVNEDLENLRVSYSEVVTMAEKVGLNPGIFDSEIPVAQRLNRAVNEDEQVRRLVTDGVAFSAGGLWNNCGTRVGNSHVVLRAQREQIAIDEAKISLVTQNRLGRRTKLLENAQHALVKYRTQGSNTLTNKDWGDIVRWVLPEAKVPGLMRDLKNRDAIVAKLATLERDWTTYIPSPPPI